MKIEIRNRTNQKLSLELDKLKDWIMTNFQSNKKLNRIMVIIE